MTGVSLFVSLRNFLKMTLFLYQACILTRRIVSLVTETLLMSIVTRNSGSPTLTVRSLDASAQ